jgi:hypothetical protein
MGESYPREDRSRTMLTSLHNTKGNRDPRSARAFYIQSRATARRSGALGRILILLGVNGDGASCELVFNNRRFDIA